MAWNNWGTSLSNLFLDRAWLGTEQNRVQWVRGSFSLVLIFFPLLQVLWILSLSLIHMPLWCSHFSVFPLMTYKNGEIWHLSVCTSLVSKSDRIVGLRCARSYLKKCLLRKLYEQCAYSANTLFSTIRKIREASDSRPL